MPATQLSLLVPVIFSIFIYELNTYLRGSLGEINPKIYLQTTQDSVLRI